MNEVVCAISECPRYNFITRCCSCSDPLASCKTFAVHAAQVFEQPSGEPICLKSLTTTASPDKVCQSMWMTATRMASITMESQRKTLEVDEVTTSVPTDRSKSQVQFAHIKLLLLSAFKSSPRHNS
eukprot:5948330-Amphidinium_carterae.1